MAVFVVGIFVAARTPLHYTINIGYETGWHSDLPFLSDWNAAEPYKATATEQSWRWTTGDSRILLPGVGGQVLQARFEQYAATANPYRTTRALTIGGAQMQVALPLQAARTVYLLLPTSVADAGLLHLAAPTFTPPNDERTLGAPLGSVTLSTIHRPWGIPPLELWWSGVLLPLVWVTSRRMDVSLVGAILSLLGMAGLLLIAQLADPLRFALARKPLLLAAGHGLLVAVVVHWLITRNAARGGIAPTPRFVRAVVLILFWLVLVRYGGRLYPESMVGDLGFHVNRQKQVIEGDVYLTARHRGILFPYPSGPYIVLAPLQLLPWTAPTLIEWADAVLGALGVLPVAYLALRGLGDERAALWITGVYALLAPSMMALWWSFLAHIFSQEAVALLVAMIIGGWFWLGTPRGVLAISMGLFLVFWGHFGLYLNVTFLLGVVLPVLWWRLRATPERGSLIGLATAFIIAQALVLSLGYSAYWPLVAEKLGQFGQGGMVAVQGGRGTMDWQAMARIVWDDGLREHYAVIGVPLALLGGLRLWQRQRSAPLTWLFWGTVSVAVFQGTVPFLTASTISTRWLSFCAWVVAVGSGVVLSRLWQQRGVGKMLAVLVVLWIGGNTLWLWIQALGYRIWLFEPF